MTEEQYIKDLDTISKFLKPIKDIPFNIVIKALSGYSIIPFNKDDVKDIEMLEKLTIAIGKATKKLIQLVFFQNQKDQMKSNK